VTQCFPSLAGLILSVSLANAAVFAGERRESLAVALEVVGERLPEAPAWGVGGCEPTRQRSARVRREFLRASGWPRGRAGWDVDHVWPLHLGGRDTPANMQWLRREEHRARHARAVREG
jgi:5-methylcytosine-specific restriction endonuclease McrA